ncbi:hypothetical protein [Clostridium tyrobutyricum]|uniref:hypothetical protein n=1 Tax=Clostridium tyrobutyricum TaxID=1519 RepID=UPI0010AACD34|nr:hypothetical protein [Clostridium tyrobutyricum]QCH28452.1 hypothetical protein EZN00_02056 [Clostridium tyrobutyricum]
MPLYEIPLCSFNYVNNICFGAPFKYCTYGRIIKPKVITLSIVGSKEINKKFRKELFRNNPNFDIFKYVNSYFLIKRNYEIYNRKYTKELANKCRKVTVVKKNKLLKVDNKTINIERYKNLRLINKELNVLSTTYLKTNKPDFIKSKEAILNIEGINKELIIRNGINLSRSWQDGIYKNNRIWMFSICEQLVSVNSYNSFNLERLYYEFCTESFKLATIFHMYDINKFTLKALRRIAQRDLSISNANIGFKRAFQKELLIKCIAGMFSRIGLRNINFNVIDKKLNKRINIRNISKIKIDKSIQRIIKHHIIKSLYNRPLCEYSYKDMNKIYSHLYLKKIVFKFIAKYFNSRFLNRKAEKNIYFKSYIRISKEIKIDIFKLTYRGLDKIGIWNIYKRKVEKIIDDISSAVIIKAYYCYMKNELKNELYKERNFKYIEVIKRWWWLNLTDPGDSLIIPNKDFNYNQELLNNPDCEYLRFINHPIGWGNTWGTDYNIPTCSTSIEIMIDLVNILIMIWHDNVQGWLCCTDKESMQFIMELLYDWYTLKTSTPNSDYYRAYRWIRWEAEKVYSLNLNTGLQAIGVLIANLIDYLKNHHFNIVPLWRNTKAMDIERDFNRIAQNGDLITFLNKRKGKRYYYIETQNTEKKNILGDDIDG